MVAEPSVGVLSPCWALPELSAVDEEVSARGLALLSFGCVIRRGYSRVRRGTGIGFAFFAGVSVAAVSVDGSEASLVFCCDFPALSAPVGLLSTGTGISGSVASGFDATATTPTLAGSRKKFTVIHADRQDGATVPIAPPIKRRTGNEA